MYPRVKDVQPNNADYTLTLTFANGEQGIFDMRPYLKVGIFKDLEDKQLFNSARPFLGSIKWPGGQDLCPDTLYLESKKIKEVR